MKIISFSHKMILFIIIILIIISVSTVVYSNITKNTTPTIEIPTGFKFATLGMKCTLDGSLPAATDYPSQYTPFKCDSGLQCTKLSDRSSQVDPIGGNESQGVCLLISGMTCNNFSECVQYSDANTDGSYYCNNVCTQYKTGGFGSTCSVSGDCLAEENLTCENGYCIGDPDYSCSSSSKCREGTVCYQSKCISLIPDGNKCTTSILCESGNCSFGGTGTDSQSYCQPPGSITGQNGSLCYDPGDLGESPNCGSGFACNIKYPYTINGISYTFADIFSQAFCEPIVPNVFSNSCSSTASCPDGYYCPYYGFGCQPQFSTSPGTCVDPLTSDGNICVNPGGDTNLTTNDYSPTYVFPRISTYTTYDPSDINTDYSQPAIISVDNDSMRKNIGNTYTLHEDYDRIILMLNRYRDLLSSNTNITSTDVVYDYAYPLPETGTYVAEVERRMYFLFAGLQMNSNLGEGNGPPSTSYTSNQFITDFCNDFSDLCDEYIANTSEPNETAAFTSLKNSLADFQTTHSQFSDWQTIHARILGILPYFDENIAAFTEYFNLLLFRFTNTNETLNSSNFLAIGNRIDLNFPYQQQNFPNTDNGNYSYSTITMPFEIFEICVIEIEKLLKIFQVNDFRNLRSIIFSYVSFVFNQLLPKTNGKNIIPNKVTEVYNSLLSSGTRQAIVIGSNMLYLLRAIVDSVDYDSKSEGCFGDNFRTGIQALVDTGASSSDPSFSVSSILPIIQTYCIPRIAFNTDIPENDGNGIVNTNTGLSREQKPWYLLDYIYLLFARKQYSDPVYSSLFDNTDSVPFEHYTEDTTVYVTNFDSGNTTKTLEVVLPNGYSYSLITIKRSPEGNLYYLLQISNGGFVGYMLFMDYRDNSSYSSGGTIYLDAMQASNSDYIWLNNHEGIIDFNLEDRGSTYYFGFSKVDGTSYYFSTDLDINTSSGTGTFAIPNPSMSVIPIDPLVSNVPLSFNTIVTNENGRYISSASSSDSQCLQNWKIVKAVPYLKDADTASWITLEKIMLYSVTTPGNGIESGCAGFIHGGSQYSIIRMRSDGKIETIIEGINIDDFSLSYDRFGEPPKIVFEVRSVSSLNSDSSTDDVSVIMAKNKLVLPNEYTSLYKMYGTSPPVKTLTNYIIGKFSNSGDDVYLSTY